MNKCFISVKCDPEDPAASAAKPRRRRRVKNADVLHEASEITSLKGQAFPLSHMAEPNTQHRLDADCLCAPGVWHEAKHDCPIYVWRVQPSPATLTTPQNQFTASQSPSSEPSPSE